MTPAELRTAWIAALESGEYPQTKEQLKDDYGYCCLGVLCDIYQKKTGRGMWVFEYDKDSWKQRWFFKVGEEANADIAPTEVEEAAGLQSAMFYTAQRSLSNANDDGATFAEIAAALKAAPDDDRDAMTRHLETFADDIARKRALEDAEEETDDAE